MIRVVIESPYAGDIERNTIYARRAMRDSIQRGEAPLASHILYTQPLILNEDVPSERRLGISLGYEWAKMAELMVFYTDYGMSGGMKLAQNFAYLRNIPVQFREIGKNA